MNRNISILHLEDQLPDSILIKTLISKEFKSFEYFFADDEATFRKALKEKKIDLILSDYQLPDYSGTEALAVAKNQYPQIPFIFVTGKMGEDAAIESLLNGATDYVLKSKLERLVPAIKRVLYEAKLIRDRADADKALRDSEEKYRSVTQSANDAIITINMNGVILGWNKGAERIFGFAEGEITGKELILIMPQIYGQAHQKNIDRVVNGGEPHAIGKTVQLIGQHKKGYEFPIELSLAGWETASGKFFTGIVRDITSRVQDEAKLRKALEKAEASDRLKDAFINIISHEIRTPLNGILGMYQILTDPKLSWQEKQEYYSLLRASSDRLVKTVTDYMDIALIVSGNLVAHESLFTPEKLLSEIYNTFWQSFEAKKVGFSLQMPQLAAGELIKSDFGMLKKIFSHLVDNAMKFTTQGTVVLGFESKGETIEFFVKDTGAGIDDEAKAAIFDAFVQEDTSVTRDHEGSGLGLSIIRGFLKLLGGVIRLESVKGEGSTFFVTLPVSQTH